MFPLKYPIKGSLIPSTPRTATTRIDEIGDEFVAELMSKEALLNAMRAKQYGCLTYLDPTKYLKEEPKERSTRPNLRFLKNVLQNTLGTNEAKDRPSSRDARNERYNRPRDTDRPTKRGRGTSGAYMDERTPHGGEKERRRKGSRSPSPSSRRRHSSSHSSSSRSPSPPSRRRHSSSHSSSSRSPPPPSRRRHSPSHPSSSRSPPQSHDTPPLCSDEVFGPVPASRKPTHRRSSPSPPPPPTKRHKSSSRNDSDSDDEVYGPKPPSSKPSSIPSSQPSASTTPSSPAPHSQEGEPSHPISILDESPSSPEQKPKKHKKKKDREKDRDKERERKKEKEKRKKEKEHKKSKKGKHT